MGLLFVSAGSPVFYRALSWVGFSWWIIIPESVSPPLRRIWVFWVWSDADSRHDAANFAHDNQEFDSRRLLRSCISASHEQRVLSGVCAIMELGPLGADLNAYRRCGHEVSSMEDVGKINAQSAPIHCGGVNFFGEWRIDRGQRQHWA